MTFLKDLGERAVKTFLQAYFAAAIVAGTFNAFEFDWFGPQLGVALGATVLSIVSSLLSAPVGSRNDASLVSAPTHRPLGD